MLKFAFRRAYRVVPPVAEAGVLTDFAVAVAGALVLISCANTCPNEAVLPPVFAVPGTVVPVASAVPVALLVAVVAVVAGVVKALAAVVDNPVVERLAGVLRLLLGVVTGTIMIVASGINRAWTLHRGAKPGYAG